MTNLTYGDVVNKVNTPTSVIERSRCSLNRVLVDTDCVVFRPLCAQREAAFRLWWLSWPPTVRSSTKWSPASYETCPGGPTSTARESCVILVVCLP